MSLKYTNVFILFILLTFIIQPAYSQPQTEEKQAQTEKKQETASDNEQNNNKEKAEKIEKTEEESSKKDNDIELRPMVVKGSQLGKRKKKNIQELSRHTMAADELKHVPASFGDALTALTALPGIMKLEGFIFFGALVIRGADPTTNNFYLDDMPIYNPMHFGEMHSVIATNFIDEIDIYASSFPASFGFATSGVINITSVDEVKEFGGYTDCGLVSVSSIIKMPILKDKNGDFIYDTISIPGENTENENTGYFIASGRYAFLKLALELGEFIMRVDDDTKTFDFKYWDYQAKSKYYLNKNHSVTMLFIGNKDYFTSEEKGSDFEIDEETNDPISRNLRLTEKYNVMSHNQALYYDYKPSKKISNRIFFYSNLNDRYFYYDFRGVGVADWLNDIYNKSHPNIFGLHDKAELKWLKGHATLRLGIGHTYYHFTSDARILLPTTNTEEIDIADDDAFITYQIDETIKNHVTSGYIENQFSIYGFSTLLGVRSDYLKRADKATFDPRILLSYKFPTDTTISAGGGKYSYFFQTNPFIFNEIPDVCKLGKEFPPEKAIHSSVGIEQEFEKDMTIKLEGFYNYFYDKPIGYGHYEADGTLVQGLPTRKLKAYGFEIMLKKDIKLGQDGLFGWLSYTYTRSQEKSGLPTVDGYLGLYTELTDDQGNTIYDAQGNPVMIPVNTAGDIYGDTWINSDYELRHTFKLVAGYTYGMHTVSAKLHVYAWQHYTPIVGGEEDTKSEWAETYPDLRRYTPVYGERNSKNINPNYQFDMRYSYKINHSWGYVSWYVEALYIRWFDQFFDIKKTNERWNYYRPYQKGVNPEIVEEEITPLFFLPNFGVEIKF